jgi:hypothetical protein
MISHQVLKAGGRYPLRDGMWVWSEAAFHEAFKVGDLIQGYGGRVTGRITAIGRRRFLFVETKHAGSFSERVGTIRQARGWSRVETKE